MKTCARHLVLVNVLVFLCNFACQIPVFSGVNDFFGGSIPTSGGPANDGISSTMPSSALPSSAPAGDYTSDERRMQKKYRANVESARKLVAKGEAMMKAGQAKGDDKTFKKGKIFKEIGERRLAELKANNPFPQLAERKEKLAQ